MNTNHNPDNDTPLENALVELSVEIQNGGIRLDTFLRELVDVIPSRAFGAKLIERGLVTVDSKEAKPSAKLKPGQKICIDTGFLLEMGRPPSAEKIDLEIIFEDKDIVIINKPAGMVVHPGAGVSSGTLVNAILSHCGATLPSLGGPERAGIVHRLDRDTSGVMVVAKSQRALTGLSAQFADHSHERTYLALVHRVPSPPNGRIETCHGRDPFNRLRFAVVPEGQGKRAALRYETVEVFCGGSASLQRCSLETGRTHQIRVQMLHVGCPLLGEILYTTGGGPLRQQKALWADLEKKLTRQMLHAHTLGIEHPGDGRKLQFTVPPPPDFQTALSLLKGGSPS